MATTFTRHAFERVQSRLSLTVAELAELLDHGRTVAIGLERGRHRVHRVFYSLPDEMCFVAIQDRRSQVVITVLPIDYHELIAWKVSPESQIQARELVCPVAATNTESRPSTGDDGQAQVFRLIAYFYDAHGVVRTANFGSWPCAPYQRRVELLLEDDNFLQQLHTRIAAKGIEKDQLQAVYVRLGKQGPPARIAVP